MPRTAKPKPPPAQFVIKSCPSCGWVDLTAKRTKCRRCFALLSVAPDSVARDAQLATARAHRESAEPEPDPVAALMPGFNPFAWWR